MPSPLKLESRTPARTLPRMLFMVIEHVRSGDWNAVGERFAHRGRMMPEGVTYHASWIDSSGARCFQVMEAPNAELLGEWVRRWSDLIDFEIVPVVNSSDFWAGR
jgi:hypothetical protein